MSSATDDLSPPLGTGPHAPTSAGLPHNLRRGVLARRHAASKRHRRGVRVVDGRRLLQARSRPHLRGHEPVGPASRSTGHGDRAAPGQLLKASAVPRPAAVVHAGHLQRPAPCPHHREHAPRRLIGVAARSPRWLRLPASPRPSTGPNRSSSGRAAARHRHHGVDPRPARREPRPPRALHERGDAITGLPTDSSISTSCCPGCSPVPSTWWARAHRRARPRWRCARPRTSRSRANGRC